MKKIKIYTTSWCGPCKMAKRLLDEKGLTYEEIDIEEKGWSRKIFLPKREENSPSDCNGGKIHWWV